MYRYMYDHIGPAHSEIHDSPPVCLQAGSASVLIAALLTSLVPLALASLDSGVLVMCRSERGPASLAMSCVLFLSIGGRCTG